MRGKRITGAVQWGARTQDNRPIDAKVGGGGADLPIDLTSEVTGTLSLARLGLTIGPGLELVGTELRLAPGFGGGLVPVLPTVPDFLVSGDPDDPQTIFADGDVIWMDYHVMEVNGVARFVDLLTNGNDADAQFVYGGSGDLIWTEMYP